MSRAPSILKAVTAVSDFRASRRAWEHRIDFVRAVVWGQFRTEFDQYFLGWLWWILEPVMQALTFLFIVALFFHFDGNRLWVILVSVVAWRWFARSVEIAPHLPRQFNPYVRTGAVSGELLFFTFLVKEMVVFVIAMTVIAIPIAFFNSPFDWTLAEVPLIMVTQFLVTYWAAAIAYIVGAFVHDVGKLVGLIVSILFYFSPGLYLRSDIASVAPAWAVALLKFNPFWAILASWQNVLVRGEGADVLGLSIWTAVSAVFAGGSALMLHQLRKRLTKVSFE